MRTRKLVIASILSSYGLTATMMNPLLAAPTKARAEAMRQTAAKPEPARCEKLRTEYDDASKRLAISKAQDSVDDSAARSTMRHSEDGNTIEQARLTLDIMRGLNCKLPDYAPSAQRYGLPSLQCGTALQEQRASNAMADLQNQPRSFETPAECDASKWPSPTE